MKIWHITDTHGYHDRLTIPDGIDMIIHTGDCSNERNPFLNEVEVWKFIEWYKKIPVKMKLFVPGNHDTSIEHKLIQPIDFLAADIFILNHEEIVVDNIKFFGSPFTPTFGMNWAFMKNRDKLGKLWSTLPNDIDVLLTHGPPLGILDLSENRNYSLEMCGDRGLLTYIKKSNVKYHLFGHVHNFKDCINSAVKICNGITFSNACPLEDGEFEKGLISNGNIIEIL